MEVFNKILITNLGKKFVQSPTQFTCEDMDHEIDSRQDAHRYKKIIKKDFCHKNFLRFKKSTPVAAG
jgi:hypothetical protein